MDIHAEIGSVSWHAFNEACSDLVKGRLGYKPTRRQREAFYRKVARAVLWAACFRDESQTLIARLGEADVHFAEALKICAQEFLGRKSVDYINAVGSIDYAVEYAMHTLKELEELEEIVQARYR